MRGAERTPVADQVADAAAMEIVRDIARGGLAGLIAGVIVAGIGGRVVMRLAALAVPASAGRFTENGNEIGSITLAGSLGLILFGGLAFGLIAGVVWVTISPWIPGSAVGRAVLTMPIAVALTGAGLINGDNTDFPVLEHSALVVGLLVGLVALAGLVLGLADTWLDGRLPRGVVSRRTTAAYRSLTYVGLLLAPFVIGAFVLNERIWPLGLALLATGAATLAWWGLRLRGSRRPPRGLLITGRAALLLAVVLGLAILTPEVADALGRA